METKTVIKLAGSATALAKLLTVTPSAITQWGKNVPDARVWQLRVLKPEWFEASDSPQAQSNEKAA